MSSANDASQPQDNLPALPEPVILPGETRNRCWERIRKEGRASGLNKHQAYDRATRETARLFEAAEAESRQAADDQAETDATSAMVEATQPPTANQTPATTTTEKKEAGDAANLPADAETTSSQPSVAAGSTRAMEPAVRGLGDIPDNWPQLPPNASLAAEIQWVQANRLRCVRETADIVSVDLTKALTPAPSYGAISWLETSIKAYTKFCDVAAKATAQLDDEKAHVRRERMAIDEIKALLAEMMPPETT